MEFENHGVAEKKLSALQQLDNSHCLQFRNRPKMFFFVGRGSIFHICIQLVSHKHFNNTCVVVGQQINPLWVSWHIKKLCLWMRSIDIEPCSVRCEILWKLLLEITGRNELVPENQEINGLDAAEHRIEPWMSWLLMWDCSMSGKKKFFQRRNKMSFTILSTRTDVRD